MTSEKKITRIKISLGTVTDIVDIVSPDLKRKSITTIEKKQSTKNIGSTKKNNLTSDLKTPKELPGEENTSPTITSATKKEAKSSGGEATINNTVKKSATVALLDVDHTLLVNEELNTSLINELFVKGITQIYLFTDMLFRQNSIDEREKLIGQLKERGFTVLGVITPNDLSWKLLAEQDEEKINQFDGNLYKFVNTKKTEKEKRQKMKEEEPQEATEEELHQWHCEFFKEHFKDGEELFTYDPTNMSKVGTAYAEAKAAYEKNDRSVNKKSRIAKYVSDLMVEKTDCQDTKALLLHLFMQQNPEVRSIVVADDKKSVIEVIKQYSSYIDKEYKEDKKITTIHIPSQSGSKEWKNPKFYQKELENFPNLNSPPITNNQNSDITITIEENETITWTELKWQNFKNTVITKIANVFANKIRDYKAEGKETTALETAKNGLENLKNNSNTSQESNLSPKAKYQRFNDIITTFEQSLPDKENWWVKVKEFIINTSRSLICSKDHAAFFTPNFMIQRVKNYAASAAVTPEGKPTQSTPR